MNSKLILKFFFLLFCDRSRYGGSLEHNKNDILFEVEVFLFVDHFQHGFGFQRVFGVFKGLVSGFVGVAVDLGFLENFIAEDVFVKLLGELADVGGDDGIH